MSRSTYYSANVDHVQLSAGAWEGRVDHDAAPVWTEARVGVAAPLPRVFLGRMKMSQRYDPAGRHVVQVRVLQAVSVRIGVVENPLITGQVRAMAIPCHDSGADRFDGFAAVFEQVERLPVRRLVRPGKDM